MNNAIDEVEVEAPEFRSIEIFVQEKYDNDEEGFTAAELRAVAYNVKKSTGVVRAELEAYGLKLEARPKVNRSRRGLNDNPYNRWTGEGATHGGSGWSQISGFAGQEG